ncbi:hypothetical protein ANO11243_072260 [Dothideomycetidae sp. 11243]|nr:hypothetical protein ANO11243_072260 [fungal sp. No.11243]
MSSTAAGRSRDIVFAVPAKKATMAVPTAVPHRETKSSNKQHKRSRSGCFTCRLRRKKCDEIKPMCKACKHLGLRCDYKRPTWWGNAEQRRDQKEHIKDVIRRTQLTKKASQTVRAFSSVGPSTPPGLCHSVSTPEGFSDSVLGSCCHSRSVSIDQSPLVADPDFYVSPDSYFSVPLHHASSHSQFPVMSPYEIDVKVERQIFVNDVPSRRDSTISSFSAFLQPSSTGSSDESPELTDTWVEQDFFQTTNETFGEDGFNFGMLDFPAERWVPHEALIEVEDHDRPLLNHFLDNVSQMLYPVLDATDHGSANTRLILPALETNRSFFHCCLSVAAVHSKAAQIGDADAMDTEIMGHRCLAVSKVCDALEKDVDHEEMLETTLAMILFPPSVGRSNDNLTDIPWHQHLQMAQGLIEKLGFDQTISHVDLNGSQFSIFAMTLTAWVDILGATMRGISPMFAATWRDLNISKHNLGLAGVMGCDDNVMYIISEIACLEERKADGMEEVMLCKYIEILGTQISLCEPESSTLVSSTTSTGALRPEQLVANMTALFRLAARIYLCSLVPGFAHDSPVMAGLIANFTDLMELVPSGPNGFDRSLSWPLLLAGSMSTPGSSFRDMLADRCVQLGDLAQQGSLFRVQDILSTLWLENDFTSEATGLPNIHWRDVMRRKGMDCLLL